MKDINLIINKFFEGNTTKEEEIILKDFISKYVLSNDYSYLKDLFEYYENENHIKAPVDFDESLFDIINQNDKKKNNSKRILNFTMTGIAASLIILFGFLYIFNISNKNITDGKSQLNLTYIDDYKLITTQQAFSVMNYYIDKGLGSMQEIEKLNSASVELQKFEKFYEYKSKLFKDN